MQSLQHVQRAERGRGMQHSASPSFQWNKAYPEVEEVPCYLLPVTNYLALTATDALSYFHLYSGNNFCSSGWFPAAPRSPSLKYINAACKFNSFTVKFGSFRKKTHRQSLLFIQERCSTTPCICPCQPAFPNSKYEGSSNSFKEKLILYLIKVSSISSLIRGNQRDAAVQLNSCESSLQKKNVIKRCHENFILSFNFGEVLQDGPQHHWHCKSHCQIQLFWKPEAGQEPCPHRLSQHTASPLPQTLPKAFLSQPSAMRQMKAPTSCPHLRHKYFHSPAFLLIWHHSHKPCPKLHKPSTPACSVANCSSVIPTTSAAREPYFSVLVPCQQTRWYCKSRKCWQKKIKIRFSCFILARNHWF